MDGCATETGGLPRAATPPPVLARDTLTTMTLPYEPELECTAVCTAEARTRQVSDGDKRQQNRIDKTG